MPANQYLPDRNLLHVRARPAPRCYARPATSDGIDQARIDAQSGAVLTALSVVTCAVAFVVAFGGWGF